MDALQNEKNYGTLIVQVSAASGAVPIPNAVVIIRATDDENTIQTLSIALTDESGITEPIAIQTPSVSESLSPGGKRPYSEITTEVSKEGYFTSINLNIPIYPGITSIQPVGLIPLPESAHGAQPSESVITQNDRKRPNL